MKCPDELLLNRYLEDQLSPEEKGEIEAHLEKCADCRLVVELDDDALPQTSSPSQEPISEKQTHAKPNSEYLALLGRGDSIGRYLIIERVGEGAMGVVFSAFDPDLDRKVALKVLRTDNLLGTTDEKASTRLLREAQAMARVVHPNVVSVHDVLKFDETIVIAMEFVDGVDLANWLREKQRSWNIIVDVFIRAGHGLEAAHEAGLVHRDFKPANVLISKTGRVCVSDFGLAKGLASDSEESGDGESTEPMASPSLLESPLTHTGGMAGTPGYMSPEQLDGKTADAKSDQFSFCVALYEALYGSRPFSGRSLKELRAQMVSATGCKISAELSKGVPTWIQDIIKRGLETKPENRFDSMEEFLEKLTDDPENKANQKRRRTGRFVTMMVLILVAIAIPMAVWYELSVRRSQLCTGGEEYVAKVWNEKTKARVEVGLVGTGVSYAKDTVLRVTSALDDYAASWKNMFAETCRATRVSGEQSIKVMDLRMICLRRRLAGMRALTEVLLEADAIVVNRAVQAVSNLEALSECADVEALQVPQARVKPPPDEETAKQVEALRNKLDKVKALLDTGKYAQGLERAKTIVAKAKKLKYLPLEAEASYWMGQGLDFIGHYEESAQTLLTAFNLASTSFHDRTAAEALSALALVTGLNLSKHEDGLEWARLAEAMEYSPVVTEKQKAQRLNALASVFYSKGEYDKALEICRRELAIKEEVLGPGHPKVATTLSNLGILFGDQGSLGQALEYHQKSLAIREKELGPEHPDVAASLNNMGTVFRRQGEYAKALESHRKSLAIRKKMLGPEHPDVAMSLENVGSAFLWLGKYDKALESLRKSLAIKEKKLGPKHPDVAMSLYNMGTVFFLQGDYEKALKYYQKSLAIREKTLGPEHPYVSATLNNMGTVFRRQGEYAKALESHRKSLAIRKKMLGPEHPDVAMSLENLGSVFSSLGEYNKALDYFRRARAILEKALGPESPYVAKSLKGIGDVLVAQGRPNLALKPLEKAFVICEEKTCEPDSHGPGLLVLARALVATGGDRGRAVKLAEQSREIFERTPMRFKKELKEVDAWLVKYDKAANLNPP